MQLHIFYQVYLVDVCSKNFGSWNIHLKMYEKHPGTVLSYYYYYYYLSTPVRTEMIKTPSSDAPRRWFSVCSGVMLFPDM